LELAKIRPYHLSQFPILEYLRDHAMGRELHDQSLYEVFDQGIGGKVGGELFQVGGGLEVQHGHFLRA
jgi:hypothetical protein